MYRVMIVDDEPLILAGIASLLDWKEYGCEISGKAANGQQALKLMEEQKPDIVITDIKMPGMDGIGFMKAVKERGWDDVIFILLTNLEEFSLARQALSLGAVEYLVKMELTEEKLADSLKLAMERREMKRKAEAAGTAVTVSREEAVRGYIEKLLTDGGTFSGGASSGNAGEASAQNQGEGYDSCLRRPVLAIISFNYGYEGFSSDFTREDQKKVISFAENIIEQMVKDYFEVSVSVAVSSRKESLGEFGALLYEAMSATNHYFYHSLDPVVFYSEECETSARHTGSFHIGFLKKDLSQAVALNDSGRLEEILDQVACLLREHNPSRQQAVNACANLYFFLSSFFEDGEEPDFPYEVNIMEKLGRLGTLGQIIQWINWFKEAVSGILERRRDTRVDKIAEMVREYVMEHYKERITLGQAAEALNISQGYLSTAFKKQSGESFTNYVSAIKIEKAKELIASHQYMMYEVSDLLGFDTPFYFSKVFKKVTGMSPKEYEAQCLKQKKL